MRQTRSGYMASLVVKFRMRNSSYSTRNFYPCASLSCSPSHNTAYLAYFPSYNECQFPPRVHCGPKTRKIKRHAKWPGRWTTGAYIHVSPSQPFHLSAFKLL
jgi:hypothetical protein